MFLSNNPSSGDINSSNLPCFTFGFTTGCLQNASEESYKNSSHPVFQESTVISFTISEIQPLFLFRKVIGEVMGVARN